MEMQLMPILLESLTIDRPPAVGPDAIRHPELASNPFQSIN